MAGKKSSGGGSCLGFLILIGLISYIAEKIGEYVPYFLVIVGCGFAIWLIVKIINNNSSKIRQMNNGSSSGSSRRQISSGNAGNNSIRTNIKVEDDNYLYETDRQIRETINRFNETKKVIGSLNRSILKNNTPWNRNNPRNINTREALEEEKLKQNSRLSSSVFIFHEEATSSFVEMKEAMIRLDSAQYKTYDASPGLNTIFFDYQSVGGDMELIKFDIEPLVITLRDSLFCLSPHYIVEFNKKGKYMNTYKTAVFKAGLSNGTWTERVAHQTWLHTRVDGGPDRRYSYNPIRTYYTNYQHTVYNMLDMRLPGFEIKYEINDKLRDDAIKAIRAYASTPVMDSYDPVHHVLRLLKVCSPSDHNIEDIESIIGD